MTAGQHIDYEALAQEAMRGVVRAVLTKVGETGLLGDHHFYIAFNTQGPGVSISKRLKEKYPVEMTIVLQHRFWDLEVNEERFEVKLTFDGIPERLVVPFRCVKVFYDPSVPYGLQFEESELMSSTGRRPPRDRQNESSRDDAPAVGTPLERTDKRRERTPRRTRSSDAKATTGADSDTGEANATIAAKPIAPTPSRVPVGTGPGKPALAEVKTPEAKTSEAETDDPPKGNSGGAKVVDFSKFRNSKK